MSALADRPVAVVRESFDLPATLDAESRSWVQRLHAAEPIRRSAIAELYDRLRREAVFHIRFRATNLSAFPRSDIDDLATQAAGDAVVVLLRKLDEYRGDSQFWTWARRFVALEAPTTIRRRLGRDRVGISRHPERVLDVADPGRSAHERVESRELLHSVGEVMSEQLTHRQRTVLTAIAVNGDTPATVAEELHTTPGAIYKSLHDARVKIRQVGSVHASTKNSSVCTPTAGAPAASAAAVQSRTKPGAPAIKTS